MMTTKEQRHICGVWGLLPLTVSRLWVKKKRWKSFGSNDIFLSFYFNSAALISTCEAEKWVWTLFWISQEGLSLKVQRLRKEPKHYFWDARTLPTEHATRPQYDHYGTLVSSQERERYNNWYARVRSSSYHALALAMLWVSILMCDLFLRWAGSSHDAICHDLM